MLTSNPDRLARERERMRQKRAAMTPEQRSELYRRYYKNLNADKREYKAEWYKRNAERVIAKQQKKYYLATPDEVAERKARRRIALQNWRQNNPDKVREQRDRHRHIKHANLAVRDAIRNGRLIRPGACSTCLQECKPEAHHHRGYEQEHHLDIVWLCSSCHGKTRRIQKP